jgi:hypothetical protein
VLDNNVTLQRAPKSIWALIGVRLIPFRGNPG